MRSTGAALQSSQTRLCQHGSAHSPFLAPLRDAAAIGRPVPTEPVQRSANVVSEKNSLICAGITFDMKSFLSSNNLKPIAANFCYVSAGA